MWAKQYMINHELKMDGWKDGDGRGDDDDDDCRGGVWSWWL